MHDFFGFIGSYWWLVFPLMGVMGAFGRGFEQRSRRRHARRLEIIHAKSEARAIARGVPYTGAVPVQPQTQPAPPEESQEGRLQRLFDAQDAVTHRWLEYELDVSKVISYPAMSDGRQPLTAAFLRAKKVADALRPSSAKSKITKEQFDEYRNAVTDYEVAFDVAERDARRIQDSGFTTAERKRLDTAKQLLSMAIDQAATPAERQIAYKRVREELDGLISLSDGAIDRLEKQVSLELTTGPPPPSGPIPRRRAQRRRSRRRRRLLPRLRRRAHRSRRRCLRPGRSRRGRRSGPRPAERSPGDRHCGARSLQRSRTA